MEICGTTQGSHGLFGMAPAAYAEQMLAFGQFTLDLERFELRRDEVAVHVEPQVFDVLRYLIEHRDRVVAKEELLDQIWGDRFVSETTLTTRIKAARRALGDSGESQSLIRTVRQRGYAFVGEVTEAPCTRPVAVNDHTEEFRFCRGEDGVRIAYAVTGAGPPLVKAANWMTHLGKDAASPVWQHWLEALANRYTLVRYDERGCGLSEWDLPSFTFQDWARDLDLVVEAAGLDRYALLGISQGAAVAIDHAARHPDRVTHLVLIGGYAVGRAARARTEEERAAAALDIELARVGWGRDDPAFRQVFAHQFFPDGPPQAWAAFDELQRCTTSTTNAVGFLAQFSQVDVRGTVPQVRCPTLILHSREDHRVPFSCAQELHDQIPGSRLVPLPSKNHLLTGTEPAWPLLLDELSAFLPA